MTNFKALLVNIPIENEIDEIKNRCTGKYRYISLFDYIKWNLRQ